MFQSTKTYGHERGLSCAFRQYKASSHCSKVHGYALSFKIVFEAEVLDDRNWVIDFGGLKRLETRIKAMFDHKFAVAKDDPEIEFFRIMQSNELCNLSELESVGCEAFAQIVYEMAVRTVRDLDQWPRVHVVSVECAEHGANSAIFKPNKS